MQEEVNQTRVNNSRRYCYCCTIICCAHAEREYRFLHEIHKFCADRAGPRTTFALKPELLVEPRATLRAESIVFCFQSRSWFSKTLMIRRRESPSANY